MQQLDRIRLAQFRQLKEEIRGSERHGVVGIDIGKEKHHAFFGTARGKALLRRLVFENSLEGFERLLEQAEAVRVGHGLGEMVFGFEPTANYHKPLADFLVRRGRQVVMVSGVREEETLRLSVRVRDLGMVAKEIGEGEGLGESDLRSGRRQRNVSRGRRLFCQLVVGKMGCPGAEVARFLGVTTSAVIRAAYSEELPELRKYL